jgi:spermidine/putrescine transport system substrate-binding protein
LERFQKETGIEVVVSHYTSNEELLAKLQAGASGYDVAFPTDYMVFAMAKLGLLQPIDRAKLTHWGRIDGRFLKQKFDPENQFSVPYDWGTTGIAIRRDKFSGKISGWAELFESAELRGKFTLLDDVRETIGAVQKRLGKSLNSTHPEDLQKAKEALAAIKRHVKAFTSEPKAALLSGETWVAHAYSTDALQARHETGGKVEYILPREGGTRWMDLMVFPKGGSHTEEAYTFVNYLLKPESAVTTTLNVWVGPCNAGVEKLLPPEYRKSLELLPSEERLKSFEMMEDLGESFMHWDRAWTEIKAGG